MDAITYVRNLRIAPSGERLNSTQKLALMLLALSLDEQGLASPSKDGLADETLVSTRSIKRILAELETMRLILPVPQFTETGQDAPTKYLILDAQGESVTRNTLERGRVLPMTRESVTESARSVTRNTLAASNVSNNLQAPPHGTRLAIIPPPPNSNNGEGVLLSPPAKIWAEIMQPYGVQITPEITELIDSRQPQNLEAWTATLKGWVASGWAKTNIDGQLDRYYNKTLKSPEHQAQGNKPSPSLRSKSRDEQEEEDRHRHLIYGEQHNAG